MADANYSLLALALVLMLASLYLRALRWAVLYLPLAGAPRLAAGAALGHQSRTDEVGRGRGG